MHRGGGTVLARVLNCHADLVLWGEHIGFINRLAEIDDMVTRVGRLMATKADVEIADYTAFPDHRLTQFEPWANPFDYPGFLDSNREMIVRVFGRGLREGQRWGFKEIRYHHVRTVRYLAKLFPKARFLILSRDIREVAASAILAPWSLRWFWDYRDSMPPALAQAIVNDVAYAAAAIELGLEQAQEALGGQALTIPYAALLDPDMQFLDPMMDFLELAMSEGVRERVQRVLQVRAGASEGDQTFGGILGKTFIRDQVEAVLPGIRAELLQHGPDKGRLTALRGPGQYTFLMGDHTLHDRGSELSSLF